MKYFQRKSPRRLAEEYGEAEEDVTEDVVPNEVFPQKSPRRLAEEYGEAEDVTDDVVPNEVFSDTRKPNSRGKSSVVAAEEDLFKKGSVIRPRSTLNHLREQSTRKTGRKAAPRAVGNVYYRQI